MRISFTPIEHSDRSERIVDLTSQGDRSKPPTQTSEPGDAATIVTGRKRLRLGDYKLNLGKMPLAPRKKERINVALVITGGTATAVGDNDITYKAGEVTGIKLLDDVDIPHGMQVIVYAPPINRDSKDFTPQDRHLICKAVRGKLGTIKEGECVEVLHGTDTQDLTAFQLLLTTPKEELKGKKVLFISAVKPHSSPDRDGPINQSHGLRFGKIATVSGIFAVANANGDVLRPPFFRKAETVKEEAFIPVNEDFAAKIKQHPITRRYKVEMKAAATDQNYSVYPLDENTVFPPVAEISSQNSNEAGFIINTIESQIKEGAKILVYEGPGDVYIRDDLDPYLRGLAKKGILIIRATDAGNGEVVRNGGYPDDEVGTICAGKLLPKPAKVLAQCVWASASQEAARNGTTLSNDEMHEKMEAAFAEYQSKEYRAEKYRSPN